MECSFGMCLKGERVILKPESCRDCPFFTLSNYITPDRIIPGSEVLIAGQAPGTHEEQGKALLRYEYYGGQRHEKVVSVTPQPLLGASGEWLQREFWPLTKLDYTKVSKVN